MFRRHHVVVSALPYLVTVFGETDSGSLSESTLAPEVFVVDTDVLIGDACDVMTTPGSRSDLLRAVRSGTAIAVMSELTFHELGRMTAVAARGRGVDHNALRALLTDEYLTCIPVVKTPDANAGHWMPHANDIRDPDDRAHVQVARLISARAVYSHDKDLRRPGVAPATRADFDKRIQHLRDVSAYTEVERAVAVVGGVAISATASAVTGAAARLGTKPLFIWSGLGLAVAVFAQRALLSPMRRERVRARLDPLLIQVGSAIERSIAARRELAGTRLVASQTPHRLEVRVASYLVREPDSSMTTIAADLNLTTAERQQLAKLLRAHPAFELVSRWGWAVGRLREGLATEPSASWRPRSD